MTSVNEINAYSRGYDKGYERGYEYSQTQNRKTNKTLKTLKLMKLTVALLIGFCVGVAVQANAATSTTTLQVIIKQEITAEVVCNPQNCPETWEEETVQVQSVQPERNWWTRVVEWIQTFIT